MFDHEEDESENWAASLEDHWARSVGWEGEVFVVTARSTIGWVIKGWVEKVVL